MSTPLLRSLAEIVGAAHCLQGADRAPYVLDGRTPISVLVAVPRGRSRLLVKTGSPARSAEDAILVSAPRAEVADGPPVLRAMQHSAEPGIDAQLRTGGRPEPHRSVGPSRSNHRLRTC